MKLKNKKGETKYIDEKNYTIFVLGYDFLNNEIANSKEPECDLAYEKCSKIADDFLHSSFNDENKGLYDCIKDYLDNGKYKEILNGQYENCSDELEI